MERSEIAPSDQESGNSSGRPLLVRVIMKIKNYVKRRPLIKYALYAVGSCLCVFLIVGLYFSFRNRADPGKIDMLSEEQQPQEIKTEEKKLKKNSDVIATEIRPEMTLKEFEAIGAAQLNEKECTDDMCGGCKRCAVFKSDTDLFEEIISLSKHTKKPAVIYDSRKQLALAFDRVKDVYLNLSDVFFFDLSKMIMKNQVLSMELKFRSLGTRQRDNKPLECAILVETLDQCIVHRFRLKNVLSLELLGLFSSIEEISSYKGYTIPVLFMRVAEKVTALDKHESFSVKCVLHIDADDSEYDEGYIYNSDKNIENRRSAEIIEYLRERDAQTDSSTFLVEYGYKGDERENRFYIIERYKMAHMVSQFYERMGSIKPGKFLNIAVSPVEKHVTGVIEWIMRSIRSLVKPSEREPAPLPYTSEEVHAMYALGAISKFSSQNAPVSIKADFFNGRITDISLNNDIRVKNPCTTEQCLIVLRPISEILLNTTAASSKMFKEALDYIEFTRNANIELEISLNNEKIAFTVKSNGEVQREFPQEFSLLAGIEKSLKAENTEQWLFSLLKSLAFAKSAGEELAARSFFGKQEDSDKRDVLDLVYANTNDKSVKKQKYTVLSVGGSLFIRLETEQAGAKSEDKNKTEIFAITDNKKLSSLLMKMFGGNMYYGEIEGKRVQMTNSAKPLSFETPVEISKEEALTSAFANVPIATERFFYTRAYFMGRSVINTIKKQTNDISMNVPKENFEVTFADWITSLSRFDDVSLDHVILYLLSDYKLGSNISLEITCKKRNTLDGGSTCVVAQFVCGEFKGEAEIYSSEVDNFKAITSPEIENMKKILSYILDLMEGDPASVLKITIQTTSTSPIVNVVAEKPDSPQIKATFDMDKIRQRIKGYQRVSTVKPLSETVLNTVNGNAIMLLSVVA